MDVSKRVRVLVAEDHPSDRRLLTRFLGRWGYDCVACPDGEQVWDLIEREEVPRLMVLDWNMPGLDGVEICKRLRARDDGQSAYILLLTARSENENVKEALEAGANDFVTKPFDPVILEARLRNGARAIDLQERLEDRVQELEAAVSKVKKLQGLLPICSYCKRVRSDENFWSQVEAYVAENSDMRFTHAICPNCFEDKVEPQLREIEAESSDD